MPARFPPSATVRAARRAPLFAAAPVMRRARMMTLALGRLTGGDPRLALALAAGLAGGPVALAAPPASADIARYEAQIERQRAQHGARAEVLVESYVGLGFAQRRAGAHAAAADSLREAVFLERIHKGLEHPDQIALIERLVESLLAAGDDAAAARYLQLLSWTNERSRAAGDPAALATAERVVRWHLALAGNGSGSDTYTHLEHAVDLTDRVIARLDKDNADRTTLARWLTLKAAGAHAAASYIAEINLESVRFVSRRQFSTGDPVSDDDVIYRQHLITRYYVGGREALERSASLARAAGDDAAAAHAVRYLGDWHLLFGRRQRADALYAEASRLAARGSLPLFDQPRQLPDFGLAPASSVTDAGAHAKSARFVRTRFDVDERGRPRNIEILETQPPHAHTLARRVRQHLARTRYRPRYGEAGAETTRDVEVRFVFPAATATGGASS